MQSSASSSRALLRLSSVRVGSRRSLSSVVSSDRVVFPNETHGVDYGTNWAVASCGVRLGSKKAFRNPCLKTVAAYAPSVLPGDVLSRTSTSTQLINSVDSSTFQEISSAACESLGSSVEEAVFLLDASVSGGSKPDLPVRCVSDDAVFTQLLSNLLCGTPKRSPQVFSPCLSLVHSKVADEVAESAYCAVSGTQVVCRGDVDTATLKQAIASAAALPACASKSVVLKASAFLDESSGTVTLAVAGANKPSKGRQVIADYVLWTPKGVTRMFNGGEVASAEASKGSVVEGKVALTKNGYKGDNYLAHPSKIVVGDVKVEEGQSVMRNLSLLGGTVEAEVNAFEDLVKAANAQVVPK